MMRGRDERPPDRISLVDIPEVMVALFFVPVIGVILILVGIFTGIPGILYIGIFITAVSSLLILWAFYGTLKEAFLPSGRSEVLTPSYTPNQAPPSQTVTPGRCQTCGSILHYGKLYCPQCSAPIFQTGPDGPKAPEL